MGKILEKVDEVVDSIIQILDGFGQLFPNTLIPATYKKVWNLHPDEYTSVIIEIYTEMREFKILYHPDGDVDLEKCYSLLDTKSSRVHFEWKNTIHSFIKDLVDRLGGIFVKKHDGYIFQIDNYDTGDFIEIEWEEFDRRFVAEYFKKDFPSDSSDERWFHGGTHSSYTITTFQI